MVPPRATERARGMPFRKPYRGFWQHVAVLTLIVFAISFLLYGVAAFTAPPPR